MKEHGDWFLLPLLLLTPIVWFSLDLERWGYKQSQEETNDSNLVTVVFDFQ